MNQVMMKPKKEEEAQSQMGKEDVQEMDGFEHQ
jgi:hypothetical protein